MDWDRFCTDVGYSKKAALEVRAAVGRAGSTELLRPIKEQAPGHVSMLELRVFSLIFSLNHYDL